MRVLAAGFGAVALAVMGMIGVTIFSAIKSEANESARKAVESELEKKKAEFKKLEVEFDKLAERVDKQAASSATTAEKVQAQINAILASAAKAEGTATAEIGAARRSAAEASADAQRDARETIAQARQLQDQMKMLTTVIRTASPELADKLEKYSGQLEATTKRLEEQLSNKVDVSKLRFFSTNVTLQGADNNDAHPVGNVKVIKFPANGTLEPTVVASIDEARVLIGAWMELDSQPGRLTGIGNFTGVTVRGNSIVVTGQIGRSSAVFAKVTALYVAK
ncbi:MAG: hypothetical protein K2X87_23785 [Gemmataceae bacterium]|nr:hypothetical protein [Gemmataceae bacterium]